MKEDERRIRQKERRLGRTRENELDNESKYRWTKERERGLGGKER